MGDLIQLNKPFYHPESIENVTRVLKSGWTGLGPEVAAFEKEFKEYIGCKYVVALNSCTEALRLAVHIAAPKKGSYAISTPNTFVSTNHVLMQDGVEPIFADIDPKTGSIKLESVKRLGKEYGKDVSLLMVVHYGGMPIEIDEFKDVAEHYNWIFIEDCAHASGAWYDHRMIGAQGKYNCFSFQAVKNLSAGDGGALTTDDEEVYKKARILRLLGTDKATFERTTERLYSWEYDCPELGYKSNMNDITAAITRGQLAHLEEDNKIRASLVDRYYDNLLFLNNVEIVNRKCAGKGSSNHLFVVRFTNYLEREKVRKAFIAEKIAFGYHYKPNYFYDPYTTCKTDYQEGMIEFGNTAMTLPMFVTLTAYEVDRICNVIQEAIK
jgi:perosamine synthetase